jgi:nitrogen fixation-related uncharacterized protein
MVEVWQVLRPRSLFTNMVVTMAFCGLGLERVLLHMRFWSIRNGQFPTTKPFDEVLT